MNRHEAIRILKKELEFTKDIDKRFGDFPEHREALDMAIKSIEQEPTTKNDLGVDCISRDAVKYYIQAHIHEIITESGTDKNAHTNAILRALLNGVNTMPSVTPQEPQTFKWCTDCKEYDQDKHCCHRWSKVIRDTVEEMKQEPRWIPVSERLPEDGERVLVTYDKIVIRATWDLMRYSFYDTHAANLDKDFVYAWMPLPKSYKADRSEEDGNVD